MSKYKIKYLVKHKRKYNMYLFILLLLIPIFGISNMSLADDKLYNPEPCDGDLILPMPDGAKMVFRPVFLDTGSNPFDFQEMMLGDSTGERKNEYPTKVRFGGSFVERNPQSGDECWMFYIGKYEVTKDQYYSIIDKSKMTGSRMPITKISWFEAQEFIHEFNLWLYDHASNDLPVYGGVPGYLRLPSEIEWEFTARGGSEVTDDVFQGTYPYPKGALNKFEFFAGPQSSHGNVKKIGKKDPNPLKVHDMLGNVMEMTSSSYHVEYYQGRNGGFVARGGNSRTQKGEMRSSLRTEMPYYKNGVALKQDTLGIRLMISSQIFTNRQTIMKQKEAWPEYLKKYRVAPDTLIFSTQPTHAQTNLHLKEAINVIKQLKGELQQNKNQNHVEHWLNQINSVDYSFESIQTTVRESERDKANAYVKIAVDSAYLNCIRGFKPMRIKEGAIKKFEDLYKKYPKPSYKKKLNDGRKRIKELDEGIYTVLKDTYVSQLKRLGNIKDEFVNDAFKEYFKALRKKGLENELRVAARAKEHYERKAFDIKKLYEEFDDLSKSF